MSFQICSREWGEPAYRAKQIADWIYQKRVSSFEAMTDLPEAMRKRLAETLCLCVAHHRSSSWLERYDPEISASPR
mgnify:CR=1 FL=1